MISTSIEKFDSMIENSILPSFSSPLSSSSSSTYHFTSSDQWKKHQVIGRGGSSTVYKVELKNTGNILAMKEVQIDGLSKDQILAIEAEIETMKSLSNPHIVNYLGTFRQQNNFYMFLEYANGGSLRQFYQKYGRLDECQVCLCTKDMLLGLSYLHSNGIAHRDIKGANVLLTANGEMKLADFGASKRLDTASIVSGLKGTPHWMAPEVIKGTQTSTGWMKADIWSLGCTVVEMITGALPFSEYSNPMTAMYHIAMGKSPPIAEDIAASPSLREFVSLCCAVDPDARPSVEDLLHHPFILKSPESRDTMSHRTNELEKILSKDEQDSSSSLNPPEGTFSADTMDEKSKTTVRVSEGQMMLQKLNRVVVIDIHANSEQTLQDEVTSDQNQVTPVIHQTRKRRSSSNVTHLQNTNNLRNSPLLPPTGKKNEKKNSLKPNSPPDPHSQVTSPSSVIKGIPSLEDPTASRSRTNSSACPTPIMFSGPTRDSSYTTTCFSPSFGDILDEEKKCPSLGPHSVTPYGYQFPINVSHEKDLVMPPPLSRSASLNDALFDQSEGMLRPIAPLSSQKINICCDVELKESPGKVSKKQPLQALEKSKDTKLIKSIVKPKGTTRSKSASTTSSPTPCKVILPPMQPLPESSMNSSHNSQLISSQSVPELALRLVQSAPCFTQSLTLPPLMQTVASPKRKTMHQSNENLSMTSSCPSKLTNRSFLNNPPRRPSFEEFEQEGGILAPRR